MNTSNRVSNGKMKLGAYPRYYSGWTIKQWLKICISAHAGSTSQLQLHPEMNSGGYFMEYTKTL